MQKDIQNKRIDELQSVITTYIEASESNIQELLREVKEMRDEVKPLVEIYTDSIGAYRTITWFLKVMAIIAAGVGAILFLKKI